MTYTEQKQGEMISISSRKLDELINQAIKKIGGKRENDLCRYLPMHHGGYMHHFTMRKMKHHSPEKLAEMLKNYITDADKPVRVPPKQRAARGSRKKKDHVVLSKPEIDRIISLARSCGDKDLLRKLSPKKELKVIKRELISSIRHGRVEPELWNSYVEACVPNN